MSKKVGNMSHVKSVGESLGLIFNCPSFFVVINMQRHTNSYFSDLVTFFSV